MSRYDSFAPALPTPRISAGSVDWFSRWLPFPTGRRLRAFAPAKSFTSTSTEEFKDVLPLALGPGDLVSIDGGVRIANEISTRLQFLRIEAKIDDIPFSESSLADFQSFLREIGPRSRPSIFLHDNGNLRAVWKNAQHEQIGLQFLGAGGIQFVIFKQRNGSPGMVRVAGIDNTDNIRRQIDASDASELFHR